MEDGHRQDLYESCTHTSVDWLSSLCNIPWSNCSVRCASRVQSAYSESNQFDMRPPNVRFVAFPRADSRTH